MAESAVLALISGFITCPHQVVPVGVVDHPALFDHREAFPLGVFDGLNHSHQGDVTAGARAEQRDNVNNVHTHKCLHAQIHQSKFT